jgi:signal transduction histidine kinase
MIVSDTGEGIEKQNLGKIFQRFYRVDKARSSETAGTGLGLSIASWIVKEHQGTISVDSEYGKGSTFKVVLPHNIK